MKASLPTQSRPNRVLRLLVVVFTVAAVGSIVLVAVDMVVGRPAAGDVFITVLNALAAFVLPSMRGREERPAPGEGSPRCRAGFLSPVHRRNPPVRSHGRGKFCLVLPGVMPWAFWLDGIEEPFDAVGCEGAVGLVSDELDVLVREPDLAVGIGGDRFGSGPVDPGSHSAGHDDRAVVIHEPLPGGRVKLVPLRSDVHGHARLRAVLPDLCLPPCRC